MTELPSGTVTFLFTDIEGSTKLLQQMGADLYSRVLSDQRLILRSVFEAFGGTEIDTQGDSFFVSFQRAGDAVAAVVQIQRDLMDHPWPEGVVVRVRMGLHTGEPQVAEEGYVGMDVHRAARIAHVGHGGQVLVSDTTAGLLKRDLPHGTRLEDLGEYQLKDLQSTWRIYQLSVTGLPFEFPDLNAKLIKVPSQPSTQRPVTLPAFLQEEALEHDTGLPSFVARERELEYLDSLLDKAFAGQGQVVFVTGGPGQGKTTLLTKFGRQAMEANADLLVASGNCNAFSGVGDPYLPFREILSMLTGDVEASWQAGTITSIQAQRLWLALPVVIESLLHCGPQVTGSLLNGQVLLARAAIRYATDFTSPGNGAWLHRLRRRIEHQQIHPEGTEQSHLFQQVTSLLRNIAETYPLLLILDDLHWADTASISLLFHLGRRLEGARILIAGVYRAEEVVLGRFATPEQQRLAGSSKHREYHPLEKVLSEFKRLQGDIGLDLEGTGESEQRRFVDALLETEPNNLGEDFKRELTRRAGGHPLFTIELVRAMQERGDLTRDNQGFWKEGPVLDWETLPVRVEGAIEARIGPLDPELREILSVACVEGEIFTLQVVSQVLGMKEGVLLRRLAQDLARQHRLVVEQAEVQIGPRRLSRFKFGHALVQSYLYQQLSQGERRLLHGEIGAALENSYGEQANEYAVQLAHQYQKAGDDHRALHYFTRAAENAHCVYANEEAYAHYTRAIEAAKRVSADQEWIIRLYIGRARSCQTLDNFEAALADYETALQLIGSMGEGSFEFLEWQTLIDLGRLWASRDYNRARECFQDALDLARRIDDPKTLAESLNWMGNWYGNQANPQSAIDYHGQALEIFEEVGDRKGLATTLDLLGIVNLLRSDLITSARYYDRAIPLLRELEDKPHLVSSLTGRGHASGMTLTSLNAVPSNMSINAQRDFDEALHLAREIGSLADEAWLAWSTGRLYTVQGRYGEAWRVIQQGLELATQIGHREWIVGNRWALGFLYLELLAAEEGQYEFTRALELAKELGSQFWIHWITGALAGALCLVDNETQAKKILEGVLSPGLPMDGDDIRFCWAKRAELALYQSDSALALDIVERLIDSAPGMAPGRVITFLWKLKGEALAALGETEAGGSLLTVALENARARGERYLLWRLHASLGQLYHSSGLQLEAMEEFSNARILIQELAETLPHGKLRQNFLLQSLERVKFSP